MKLEKIFKSLILIQIALILSHTAIDFLFPRPDMPQELQLDYIKSMNFTSQISLGVSCLILIILSLVGFYKLYKFRNTGRLIYVSCYLLSVPIIISLGNIIETPWTYIVTLINNCITGFLIALMYFSPLKEKFIKRNEKI